MSGYTMYPGYFVALAALLFGVGAAGALCRRNALSIVMSIEIMLNAGNLAFMAYAKQYGSTSGHVLAFLVMAIAAAEAAVGLAILIGISRTRATIEVDELDALRDQT